MFNLRTAPDRSVSIGRASRPQDYLGAALIIAAGILLLKLRATEKEEGVEIEFGEAPEP